MDDALDAELHDDDLMTEIDLVTDLMITAAEADSLDQSTIDGILGVSTD